MAGTGGKATFGKVGTVGSDGIEVGFGTVGMAGKPGMDGTPPVCSSRRAPTLASMTLEKIRATKSTDGMKLFEEEREEALAILLSANVAISLVTTLNVFKTQVNEKNDQRT